MSEDHKFTDNIGTIVTKIMDLIGDKEFQNSLRGIAKTILQILPPEEVPEEMNTAAVADADLELSTEENNFKNSPRSDSAPVSNLSPSLESWSDHDEDKFNNKEDADVDVSVVADESMQSLPADVAVGMLHFGRSLANTVNGSTSALDTERESKTENQTGNGSRKNEKDEKDDWGIDISLVRQRCLLKAEAARWAAERRRLIDHGVDFQVEIQPTDRDLIARAKEMPECFLWTNNPSCPEPAFLTTFEELGHAYENLAESLLLIETVIGDPDLNSLLGEAMQFVAEAQSIVREAARRTGFEGNDVDQFLAYDWLKDLTQQRGIFIPRYMKTEDVGDPADSQALTERLAKFDSQITSLVRQIKTTKRLLGKVSYESKMTLQHPFDSSSRINTITRAIEELVPQFIPPSHVELRDYLLPILDLMDDVDTELKSTCLVLREIETFLSRNPEAESKVMVDDTLSEAVIKLRPNLRGKKMYMIGGIKRPLRQEAIRRAFELEELVWETVNPHTSLNQLLPMIKQEEVALVLLAIRWSSHDYSGIQEVCRQFGKPLVRLPGGTNPNQIANQIIGQAANRLQGVE